MSTEAMKLAAEFNRYFTSANGAGVRAKVSVTRDEWRVLFNAIQQTEAQQPATGEPERCKSCDNTGHVVDQIGEWRGICNCPEGDAIREKKTATSESVAQWQKRHPVRTAGRWQSTDEHDAKWWHENAKGWEVRALYTRPAPSVPDDVARDAERYRWLRNEANFAARVAPQVCMLDCLTAQASALHAEAVDEAIDAAMLAANEGSK